MTQSGGEDMGPAENRKVRTENPAPKPKALVLYGYGLNCDYETAYALERAGAEAEQVHVSDLISGAANLMNYHVLPVAGGFSWGDDHGAGVILALRLKLGLGSALQEFIAAGRLVIGICNGSRSWSTWGCCRACPGAPRPAWRRSSPTTAVTLGTPGSTSRPWTPRACSPKGWTF